MTEPVWLIEWPENDNEPVRWWNPVSGWMRDANKATHFVRKQDAESVLSGMLPKSFLIVTEHKFLSNPTLGLAQGQGQHEVCEALDAIDRQLNEMRSLKGWRLNLIRENMAKLRAALAPGNGAVEAAGPNPLRIAMTRAIDLLTERTYGSPARSPGHNARLVLEAALKADSLSSTVRTDLWACTGCGSQKTMDQIKGEHPQALSCCPERKMAPVPQTPEASK